MLRPKSKGSGIMLHPKSKGSGIMVSEKWLPSSHRGKI